VLREAAVSTGKASTRSIDHSTADDGDLPPLQAGAALMQLMSSGMTLGAMGGQTKASQSARYVEAHGLYTQGKYAQALPLFRVLYINDHLDMRFAMGLAGCLQMLQRYGEAARYYGAASVLDLTDPTPVIHLAECLLGASRRKEAIEALKFAEGQARGEARYAAEAARVQALLELVARAENSPTHTEETK
jgi:type III secretion system low calcium response chaperone LcrH/SycD